MKKKLIFCLLIFFILINYFNIIYAATLSEEKLIAAFSKLSFSDTSDDSELNISIDSVNKKINFSTEDNLNVLVDYKLSDDATTFTYEYLVNQGMSYEEYTNHENNSQSAAMYCFLAAALASDVPLKDALAFYITVYLGSILTSFNKETSNYIIYNDLNKVDGIEVEFSTSDPSKLILASEFGNRVIEYVNATYTPKRTILDNEIINYSVEKTNLTETSIKMSSTLTIKPDADFSIIKGFSEQLQGSLEDSTDNSITKENADYVIELEVGQTYKFTHPKNAGCTLIENADYIEITKYAEYYTFKGLKAGVVRGYIYEPKNINGVIDHENRIQKTLYISVKEKETSSNAEKNNTTTNQNSSNTNTKPSQNPNTKPSQNPNTTPEVLPKDVLIIPPTKTKYNVGEKLNLEGLSITAVYPNNKIEQITKDYTITGYNKNKKGKQTVTISYKGFSKSYDVQVGKKIYNTTDNNNSTTTPGTNIEKLPQTGNFSYVKPVLYLISALLYIALIYIVCKSYICSKTKDNT